MHKPAGSNPVTEGSNPSRPAQKVRGKNMFKRPGVIKAIVKDDGGTVVYIEHRGITGLDISRCRGFTPQKGDKAEVIIGLREDDYIVKK